MSLNEEFRQYWTGVGYALGFIDGYAIGKAIAETKFRARMIDSYMVSVRIAMDDLGATFESAMCLVPSDIADDVRTRFES